MDKSMTIIEVKKLCKNYNGVKAVDGISIVVQEGEIFGMIGPNGAGKTTTIECIEGLRQVSSGEISVLGLSPYANRKKLFHLIGAQLQETQFQDKIKVLELCKLFSSFYNNPLPYEELLTEFELNDKRKAFVNQLSGGQKQRLSIIVALISNPKIIFLDELTTGLDPQARHAMWDLIKSLRDKGITIFLTTHFMDEAEALCSRIAVIDQGKLVALNTPANLIKESTAETKISFYSNQSDIKALKTCKGIIRTEQDGDVITVYGKGQNILGDLVAFLQKADVEFSNLTTKEPNLEDVFLKLTGRKIRGSS